MGVQDLIITPFYFLAFIILAAIVRPLVTTPRTKGYFLPAIFVKFLGAVALGVVYFFHYKGGDTINFWQNGSKWIWLAIQDNPLGGFKLLMSPGTEPVQDVYHYTQYIWYYGEPSSYLIVRLAAFFDLFTFHTYSATALFFALFSFSGLWAMFYVIQRKYPSSTHALALGILFFPSLVFWGSGILKDTITIGAVGWMTYVVLKIVEYRRFKLIELLILLFSVLLIYKIKIYILICYVSVLSVWFFAKSVRRVNNLVAKVLIFPILLFVFGLSGFFLVNSVSSQNDKYRLENLANQAKVTAYDIRYGWGARLEGHGGYDLGALDGSFGNMLELAPKAITVTLFRPFLWEVRNPFMLLSAIEGLIVLILVARVLLKRRKLVLVRKDPFLLFCLLFTILFSFAVGVSSFNFGTLMRYKIPMIPFLMTFLAVTNYGSIPIQKKNWLKVNK